MIMLLSKINKLVIKTLPFELPDGILRVHKDNVGKRTWCEWLRNNKIFRMSFGYKMGENCDACFIQLFNNIINIRFFNNKWTRL